MRDKSLKFGDALAILFEDQSIQRIPENDEVLIFLEIESIRKPWIREIIESYSAEYDLMLIPLIGRVLTHEQDDHRFREDSIR